MWWRGVLLQGVENVEWFVQGNLRIGISGSLIGWFFKQVSGVDCPLPNGKNERSERESEFEFTQPPNNSSPLNSSKIVHAQSSLVKTQVQQKGEPG